MTYIETVYELNYSNVLNFIIVLVILITFIVILIRHIISNKRKDSNNRKFIIVLLSIFIAFCALLTFVYGLQTYSPIMYFDNTEKMTMQQAQEFTKRYAIIENIGNIYRVQEKSLLK